MFENKSVRLVGVMIGVVLVLILGKRLVTGGNNASSQSTAVTSDRQIALDNSIEIPISTTSDESITYRLDNAEITGDIVLKGQKARAVSGKIFLLLNLKLTNPSEKRVSISTRDYLRLSVAGTEDKLAPSIHNDPVEVQPISDQFTRVGFSVPADASEFTLYMGEIDGDKTEIPLSL